MVEATNIAFDVEAIINKVLRRPTWGRLAHEPVNHNYCHYLMEEKYLVIKKSLGTNLYYSPITYVLFVLFHVYVIQM